MKITLYEQTPSRSVRCRWTLLELGLEFESIAGRHLFHSEELTRVQPLGKLPAVVIDGRPLFESAAICTYLADAHPDKGLIARSGTWERALHDQWTSFALTELEAWLWHTAKHTFVYPEEARIPAVIAPNGDEVKKGAAVLDDVLSSSDFLVADRFSVTDIIAGFTVNWGRRAGLIGDFPALEAYLDRLYERPHCTLRPPE